MVNLDFLKETKLEYGEKFRQALESKDDVQVAEMFESFGDALEQKIIERYSELQMSNDKVILTSRGQRQLTSAEQSFYDGIIGAFKAPDPKAALAGVETTFPVTIIDEVINDIQSEHPLLAAINFQNTTGTTRWLYSDDSTPLATWGTLTSAITEEMSATIRNVDFNLTKLSAFIPVPKDLLELGAVYLDTYVRAILSEAAANGLEYGFFKGTGKNQPIGMIRNLSVQNNGEYAVKEKIALNSFEPAEYCALIAELAKRENGSYRNITEVALVINPKDYITKIVPATTIRGVDGTYKSEIFPFPTKVYPSSQVSSGEAILGISINGKIYYKAFYAGALSKIDYSDEARWLEDERVYITKLYAYGRPVDNTSFIYLNISALTAAILKVKLVSDDAEHSESGDGTAPTYVEVQNPTGNPSTSGYYELIGENYVLSEDTEVDAEKTYYILSE